MQVSIDSTFAPWLTAPRRTTNSTESSFRFRIATLVLLAWQNAFPNCGEIVWGRLCTVRFLPWEDTSVAHTQRQLRAIRGGRWQRGRETCSWAPSARFVDGRGLEKLGKCRPAAGRRRKHIWPCSQVAYELASLPDLVAAQEVSMEYALSTLEMTEHTRCKGRREFVRETLGEPRRWVNRDAG